VQSTRIHREPDGADERDAFQRLQAVHFAHADAAKFTWQTKDAYLSPTERLLLKHVSVHGSDRLLEIGCGEGGNLELMNSLPAGAVGVDFSRAKVSWANRHLAGARFVCADAGRLPFPDETFDVILCRDVLHHVPDKSEVVNEMVRVCRTPGRMVIIEPNGRSPIMKLLGILVPAERDLLRNSLGRLQPLLERPQIAHREVVWAQPFPLGRILFHYRWGLPGLSKRLGRPVLGIERTIGRMMPSDRWGYMILTAVKRLTGPKLAAEGLPETTRMRFLQEPMRSPAERKNRSDHPDPGQEAALATGATVPVPQGRIGGETAARRALFDALAPDRDRIKRRHWYYYALLSRLLQFMVPPGRRVLEVGCGTGDLLAALQPTLGVGLDLSGKMLRIARTKFPDLRFVQSNAQQPSLSGTFDYIILSDLVGDLEDVQEVFTGLKPLAGPETRLIITYYNYLWEPILKLAERLGLKSSQNVQNWLPVDDIDGFLSLAGFATIRKGYRHLLPVYLPGLSWFCNQVLAHLPGLRRMCLTQYLIAKAGREHTHRREYRCSVIVPCRNEAGNIAEIVSRTPTIGAGTELIFVDGNSTDGTVAVIQETIARYQGPHTIRLIHQGDGTGKGDAVRKGFDAATGEVLMILDADVTVDPETLPKFYRAIADGHGEFVNGSRLVYPMQSEAMRWLNLLGNKFFSMVFTWLLEQRLRDTLCGTKALRKQDYEKIKAGRQYFGDFDPFGDFDLLFGAAKQNMKIVEVPVRYRDRTYGETKIQRFRHGLLLLRMCWEAYKRFRMS